MAGSSPPGDIVIPTTNERPDAKITIDHIFDGSCSSFPAARHGMARARYAEACPPINPTPDRKIDGSAGTMHDSRRHGQGRKQDRVYEEKESKCPCHLPPQSVCFGRRVS